MAKWTDIGAAEEFGTKKCITVEKVPLVVCQLEDDWHCVVNVCPHAGMPLGEGDLTGKVITCPFHGYAYNVESGKNVDYEDDIPLDAVDIRVTDAGRVEVDLEGFQEA